MNEDPPASISINLTSAPVYGILGTEEELKAKLEKRKAEAAAVDAPGYGVRFAEWVMEWLVVALVAVMHCLPWMVGLALLLYFVSAMLGAVGVLWKWGSALWNWLS